MAASLSEERKGQIALIIMKKELKGKQIYLNRQDLKRKIGNNVEELKEYGVAKEELESLYEEIIREAVEEMFTKHVAKV